MPVPTRTRASNLSGDDRRLRAGLVAALIFGALALALALVPTSGASAHDYLIASTPTANSTQTTPLKKVTLTFDDIVLDLSHDGSSALLQVTGPDGGQRHFETGCPTISGRDVSAPVSLGAAGKYRVTWQIVSADGHTVSDSIEFSYQPPAGTTESQGAASRPDCGRGGGAASTASDSPAASAPSGTSTSAESGSSESGALGIVITIAAVIVALAVIGVVIVLATSRRKPQGDGTRRKAPPAPEDD